jgi:NAD(P)-dependent dehydrogenase (short-subunit alcohol dehydrogenase family)
MEISLSRRAAIVTGGRKGLGFAIAARFAASGADVAIVARTGETLEEAVAAIRTSSRARVIGVQADIGKAVDESSPALNELFGGLGDPKRPRCRSHLLGVGLLPSVRGVADEIATAGATEHRRIVGTRRGRALVT